MIRVARNYIIGTGIIPPDPEPDATKVTLQIKFAGNPTSAVAAIAPRKFNKEIHWGFDWDDASFGAYVGLNILNNAFYTDGCGNNIPYAGSLAINGANELSGLEYEYDGSDGKVSIANMLSMINSGWEISDHSYYHDPVENGADKTAEWNTIEMRGYIKRKLNYWTRSKVVPTNYPGHAQAAFDLGYLYSTSQGTFDSFTAEWMYAPPGNWANVPANFAPVRRDFTDEWPSSLSALKSMVDTLKSSANKFFRMGTHSTLQGAQVTAFQELINYMQANSSDKFLVSSTREWLEYDEMKVKPFTQSLIGDTLTIETDLTTLDEKMRWKDQSFNITSDKAIISVTTDGDSASFNRTTGLVNSFKQKKQWL